MLDGINSDAEAIHEHYPDNPVACYADGPFAWSGAQQAMFDRKIRISVVGSGPQAAYGARVIDVERGAATPGDVKHFILTRQAMHMGHTTTVYCSAANVKAVISAVGDADLVNRWWIADWTGKVPTVGEVAASVRENCGVDLPDSRIWACQYANEPQWDLSVVFGEPDFAH